MKKDLTQKSVYALLSRTVTKYSGRPAVSFQLDSNPKAKAETLNWGQLLARVTQAANGFKSLGVSQDNKIAYILPICTEAVITFVAGTASGVVVPISPLLEPKQMAGILKLAGVKIVVSMKALPKTDVAQKVAEALEDCPDVTHLVEVDLVKYLGFPKSWIAPLIRPKVTVKHTAAVIAFDDLLASG